MRHCLGILLALAFLLGGGAELQWPAAQEPACCGMALDDGCPCPMAPSAPCSAPVTVAAVSLQAGDCAEAAPLVRRTQRAALRFEACETAAALPGPSPRAPQLGRRLAFLESWRI